MSKNILIIDGHPDPSSERFGHALVLAYSDGAWHGGHTVKTLRVCDLDFPLLRTAEDFHSGKPVRAIAEAQEMIGWADHLVIFYPLWLGTMPALLKGFFEQVFRPGFGIDYDKDGDWPKAQLNGCSARIVVTMGMPEMAYRWYYRAHSLKSLERNVLKFCGISPVRDTVLGMVEKVSGETRLEWLEDMKSLGADAR